MSKTIVLLSAPRSRSAFTLVELLVVVAIIGILAGIITGISGYASRKADRTRAVTDMEKIKGGLEEYRVVMGRYWKLSSGVTSGSVLTLSNFGKDMSNYVKEFSLTDPWGRGYQYVFITNYSYRLYSQGPDSTTPDDDVEQSAGRE